MVLTELKTLVKDQIKIVIPDIEETLGLDMFETLVVLTCSLIPQAVINDLDQRLATGGSYVEKVAELRSDLQIEA